MTSNVYLRPKLLGQYILENKSTIRKTASEFGISKSTVHVDVSYKLKNLDYELYKKVKLILENNFKERNIRGGIATKNKYESLKKHSAWMFFCFFIKLKKL